MRHVTYNVLSVSQREAVLSDGLPRCLIVGETKLRHRVTGDEWLLVNLTKQHWSNGGRPYTWIVMAHPTLENLVFISRKGLAREFQSTRLVRPEEDLGRGI